MNIAISELRQCIDTQINGNPEKYYYVTLHDKMVKIICEHMDDVLYFISKEATDEEIYWLCEVIELVMEQTHNAKYLHTFRSRVEKIKNEQWKEQSLKDVDFCLVYID